MLRALKDFQQKAVTEILDSSSKVLNGNAINTVVLQSPTGSGKTYMMSKIIHSLATADDFEDFDLCFLWVCIGKGALHEQSYKSLKTYFSYPNCYLIENYLTGGKKIIERNDILVLNWEKLRTKDKEGNWTNNLMKDKETYNFRDVLENTKAKGRKIVLIIDESHVGTTTDRAKELRDEIICPDLTIEMSATPVFKGDAFPCKVKPIDVIDDGLIKKEIIINPNIDKISDNELDSELLVLEAAYQKQQELKAIYAENNIEVNPLVLVQIPNSAQGEEKKEVIEKFLKEYDISQDKGNLAVWLSDEKVHIEAPYLIPNTSNVDFLIFKQAIDTGWDCPRASILIKFREVKSETFEIQTLGRILRMPEAKHYDNDELNKAFVFTNLQNIIVKNETYNPNIIKNLTSKRADIGDFALLSYYKQRISFNDITAIFNTDFEREVCNYFGFKKGEYDLFNSNFDLAKKKGLKLDNLTDNDEIILNETISAEIFDTVSKISGENKHNIALSENDKSRYIDTIINSELQGYTPVRSIPMVKNILLRNLRDYFRLDERTIEWVIFAESIILNNEKIIRELLFNSISNYKATKLEEERQKASELRNFEENWQIIQEKKYNPNTYEKLEAKLSLMSPCYLKERSTPEQTFIDYIDTNAENIDWWWKNGDEHMRENFGIKYTEEGNSFQPDFIIKYKDGRIGIYDTKGDGFQEDDNKIKAEALQQYIQAENKKGKNLCGGIIIVENGHLLINNKAEYNRYKTNRDNWENFSC